MAENVALSASQAKLVEALLAGANLTVAATTAGIAYRTANRWWKLECVQQAYKAGQKSLFDQALTGLMLKVEAAIETLDRHMTAEETPASSQIRAAQIVLEQAISIHKMSDLEARLHELETQFGIKR